MYCSSDAYCYHQSPSTYLCKCKPGYSGDGITCIEVADSIIVSGMEETGKIHLIKFFYKYSNLHLNYYSATGFCGIKTLKCSVHATCKVAEGSYYCQCGIGYAGNGIYCTTETGC